MKSRMAWKKFISLVQIEPISEPQPTWENRPHLRINSFAVQLGENAKERCKRKALVIDAVGIRGNGRSRQSVSVWCGGTPSAGREVLCGLNKKTHGNVGDA